MAAPASFAGRLRAVAALFKLRLTSLVLVVSAVLGHLLGVADGAFLGWTWACWPLADLLVTGASNAHVNQVMR